MTVETVIYDFQSNNYLDHWFEFSSVLVPILQSTRLKSLHISNAPLRTSTGDMQSIKVALQSNQSLKKLRLYGCLQIERSSHMKLLVQGIAAAPKLRHVDFKIHCYDCDSTAREISEIFADTLREYRNTTLEHLDVSGHNSYDDEVWERELATILQFNEERRRFQHNKHSLTQNERLVRAFNAAQTN
jgi:hypothetical protein